MTDQASSDLMDTLPTQQQMLSMSGLEFMQGILSGALNGPPIAKTLNFWLTEVEDGRITFEGIPGATATNPLRTVHGGWYGTVLDSCMACAVMTKVPKGSYYTTLEFKVNIIRSIPIDRKVKAIGVIQHAGRSTGIANGEIRDLETDALYATGSTTCIIMKA
ncbi:MAG: PaaI family thioesterase [Pseudomonadota bacterium]|nr:PaaI family thioesterase [Pseudomonadota bacterium]